MNPLFVFENKCACKGKLTVDIFVNILSVYCPSVFAFSGRCRG